MCQVDVSGVAVRIPRTPRIREVLTERKLKENLCHRFDRDARVEYAILRNVPLGPRHQDPGESRT